MNITPKNRSGYFEGQGCTCCAYNESECRCGADWTDPEVYRLKELVEQLERLVLAQQVIIDAQSKENNYE